MDKVEFTFVGGDNRQKHTAVILAKSGFLVRVFGLDIVERHDNIHNFMKLDPDLFHSQVFLLPIPYKDPFGNIQTSLKDFQLAPESLFRQMKQGTVVIYAKKDKEIMDLCKQYSVHGYDLIDEESFSVLNAVPTAEGALLRGMERTTITLHGAKVLILGYGRIGRVLSKMLQGIGSLVTVEARSNEDLAWIKANGYQSIGLDEVDTVLGEQDLIFNTIPAMILDRSRLAKVRSDCIIIDLASHPGGVDFQAATEFGLSASLDLGLPGIVAPKTAAQIICQVTYEILKRH